MLRFKVIRFIIDGLLIITMLATLFLGIDDQISVERELFYQLTFVFVILLSSIDDLVFGMIYKRKIEEPQPEYNNIKRNLLSVSLINMFIGILIFIFSHVLETMDVKIIQLFFILSIISSFSLTIYRFVRK